MRTVHFLTSAIFIPFLIMIIPVSSSAELVKEIFTGDFYRAPGGNVIFRPPTFNEKIWTVTTTTVKGMRHYTIYWGNPKNYQGRITFVMPKGISRKVSARNMALSYAKTILNSSKFLKATNRQQALKINSGSGYFIGLMGINPGNVNVAVGVIGIADDTYAMTVIIETAVKSFNDLYKVADSIFKNIKIGKSVPRLPKRNPGLQIHGIYNGPLNSDLEDTWRVFDRRGYYSELKPSSELRVDLEALYQYKKKNLSTYEVTGDRIILTNSRGKKKAYPFKKTKWRLYINNGKWERFDGPVSNGLKLEGHYQDYSHTRTRLYYSGHSFTSSRDYYFKRDGRFSFSSTFYTHSDHYGKDMINTTGKSDASAGRNSSGRYVIKNNRLYLRFSNGKTAALLFYPCLLNGEILNGKIVINGSTYLMK